MWIALLCLSLAQAADGLTLGVINMPVTPSGEEASYHGLAEVADAGSGTWTTEAKGFRCEPAGKYVELTVDRATWPIEIPKSVTCTDGKRKAKFRVLIDDKADEAMFLANGTLVLPRLKGATSKYQGPPPRTDLPVQSGRSETLGVECKVVQGPTLTVIAPPTLADGSGRCALKTSAGDVYWIDVVVRSHKPL